MNLNRRKLGEIAEDRVADWLKANGWTLIARRFSTHHGELDIIALDGEEFVIVEVKSRLDGASPEDSMSVAKMASLHRAVSEYFVKAEESRPYRIDLAAVDGAGIRLTTLFPEP